MKKSLGNKILVGAVPVWVIGTYDRAGKPNMMTAAWSGVCCSEPPCLGVSLRKATYSYEGILVRRAFTVNIPSAAYAKEADYVGIASGRDEDKWQATGLTAVQGDFVDAPYVAQFPLVIECRLLHALELGLHTRFIGEIMDVKVDESVIGDDGMLNMEGLDPILYTPGNRGYQGLGRFLGKGHSLGRSLSR